MKSSTFVRTIELAKLAALVGLKEIRSGDLKSRLEQAVLIANSLSHLKGAAMKAGQLLSLDLSSYFPDEAIEVLSQLQNAAVAQPFSQVQKSLKQELGPLKIQQIVDLSSNPIGVASIGQVHRARFQGQDIVLKVQYPGVADSIDSDLKILKTIASSFCHVTGRQMMLEPLFQEFRSILHQELDYQIEAQYQKEYSVLVNGIKSLGVFEIHVPTVIEELSTHKVLAMTYEEGLTLKSWIATKPAQAQRESLAHTILDLYFHEFFAWGLVQTDPNMANFLVRETGPQPELVLLDFGATRRYSNEFIRDYIRLLQLAAEGKSILLKEHAIQFGLLDYRESSSAFSAFEQTLRTAIQPFFTDSSGKNEFDFSNTEHAMNSQKAAKVLANELVYSPPPYSLVFLHRKLGGVYSVLNNLEVTLDISSYWQKMLEYSTYKGTDGTVAQS
jgi:aarF domain-containing kinase